ncbi:MAG: MBL fold metallo-hydrolase [Tepidisphaeraceae bacterium]
MSWRHVTDFAKRKQWPLHVAARLGRGRGRLRVLDRRARLPAAPLTPNLVDWHRHRTAAAWLGHATLLLRIGGQTILTDPVFSPRVGIGLGLLTAGPLRHQRPAVTIDELPAIDIILLSHAHFDHLDRPTLSRLPKRSRVVASRGLRDLVDDLGFARVDELSWGESQRIDALTITAQPVKHWGARTFYDTHRGYGAFLLEGDGRRVLYGADTAYHEDWRGMGKVDLAIVGIGAYDPYIAAHANPEQALAMADHVQAERVLPMHHSTFKLSHEPMTEPIERILTAAGTNRDRIVVREVGGVWTDA